MAAPPSVPLPPATSTVGFQTAPHISSGTSGGAGTTPYRTVLGDFDGDGKMDVASVVQDIDSHFLISVLLSNGDGTFQDPVLTPVTFGANDLVAAATLNGDLKWDVVLVHSNSVDVLISTTGGNFATAVNYPDAIPTPAAVGLLNASGDSSIDIIVANATPDLTAQSPVAILPGDGTGLFGSATIQHYNGTMEYGVIADVNGDSLPDLVSANQVFLRVGSDYPSSINLSTTSNTCGEAFGSVVVADVTGDSQPDIITADCLSRNVTAYVNQGGGAFDAGTSTAAGYRPTTLAVADFNGDTQQDVVVADSYSMDLMVLLGNNDGSFQIPSVAYPVGGDLWTAPLVSDFGQAGHHDIVIPSGIPDEWASLVYLAGTFVAGVPDGTLVAPHDYYYAGGLLGKTADSYGIATADLNDDGLPDFVVGNLSDDTNVGVTVFLSNFGSKTLDFGANYGSGGNLEFVALTDVDGDGFSDLIASSLDGSLQVFLGQGDGTFGSKVTIPVTSTAGLGQLVVGKFDAGNKPDIAVLDSVGNVWVLLNTTTITGSPTFAIPVPYALTTTGWEIATSDLRASGHLDLVITQAQSTAVSILFGNGTGGFTPQSDFDLGSMYPGGMTVAQLNPSGHPDLIVTIDDSNAGMGVAVAPGIGNGTFGSPTLYPATSAITGSGMPFPAEVRVADLNGDGNLDLVFTNAGSGTVGVLYGTGQWGVSQSPFYAPVEFFANDYPPALLLADVNGDGALDAVIGSFNYSGVTTLLNTGADFVALSGGPSTFTATVTPLRLAGDSSTINPTGSVTFRDGTASLGVVALSSGTASISPTLTDPGTHVITAVYSGDDHFVGQTKATFIQNVDAVGSNYLLTANPTNATLLPGQSANFTVTASPNPSSTDTVNFSCGTLPQGLTCVFNPTSITLNGITPQTTTLTVSVAPTFVASNGSAPRLNHTLPFAGLTVGVLGWFVLGGFRRPRRSKVTAVLTLFALSTLIALVGCAAAPTTSNLNPTPIPKTIHVMATSQGKGTTQQLNLNITIQP
jgi:hypothetical protein